jgi:nicotinamidase/pyrazinamidase
MVKLILFVLSVSLVVFLVPGIAVSAQTMPGWAVLVIDVQTCFVEGGGLAVAGTDKNYVKKVNRDTKWLSKKGYLILGSRDYHPQDHISFASNHPGYNPYDVIDLGGGRSQVLWPDHCVQTVGDSRALVDNNLFFELVKKGQDPLWDSYSAFKDDGGAETELEAILDAQGVNNLIVYGIATDYCVYYSVLDALGNGHRVIVVDNLNRGVADGTTADAIAAMKLAGAEFVTNVKDAHKKAKEPGE